MKAVTPGTRKASDNSRTIPTCWASVYESRGHRYASRMLALGLTSRARWMPTGVAAIVLAAAVVVAPGRARATGESITDVRVLDNQRTEEATIRSIAGVSIGETLEADTLDRVRERLNTSGLFSDINVWW